MRTWVCIPLLAPMLMAAQNHLGDSRKEILQEYSTIAETNPAYHMELDTIPYEWHLRLVGPEPVDLLIRFDRTDPYERCDSVAARFTCGECFARTLSSLGDGELRRWRTIGEEVYMERGRCTWDNENSTVASERLTVLRTPGEAVCGTLCFSQPMLEKNTWRKLRKGVKCPDR